MDTINLVRMANRIGDFFEAMPEREEAIEGIAQHIKKFWEPRMRGQLLAAMEAGEAAELQDIVRTAVVQHRLLLS
jgi:formate dehydrogenase subunit delta